MSIIDGIVAASPKTRARLTGAVYLAYFALAIGGAIAGSHSATGRVVNIVSIAVYAGLTVLFYFMFEPVSRWVSLLAALFSFTGCVFSVVQIVQGGKTPVSPLVFFGFYCLLLGQLVIRSRFLPVLLGLLLVVAGAGWLLFLFPFAAPLNGVTEVFGIVAEGALCLWLLIAGVKPVKKGKRGMRRVRG